MILKLLYAKQDDIPTGFETLFTEKDGKWVLTEIEGLKTQDDISRLTSALDLEKKQHAETKKKWAAVTSLNLGPDEIIKNHEEIEDLRTKVELLGDKGNVSEQKLNEAVQKRLEREQAKWERERKQLTERAELAEQDTGNLRTEINRSKIETEVRKSCAGLSGFRPEAVADALMLAERVFHIAEDGKVVVKDQVGFTPGITVQEFLEDRKADRSHWWEGSVGGKSKSTNGVPSGVNPWKAETRNLTQQGQIFQRNPVEARRLAAEAGVTLAE